MNGMGLGKEACQHAVSFLLGAVLPTALLVFLASDRLGEGLSSISGGWAGSAGTKLPAALAQVNDALAEGSAAPPAHGQEVVFKGLSELLQKVTMEDRTVIITSVNEAWAQPGSLLDLFLDSFKNGEDIEHFLNHLIVVALDARGFEHCKALHPHCYLLNVTSTDLSSAESYKTPGYLDLVWTKLTFQQRVLELGYNFLFMDCDMVLFRNPFWHFPVYADMSCSVNFLKPSRAPLDQSFNTGVYYMKSTNRTIEMMKYWRSARERFPGQHDQEVFISITHEFESELQAKIVPLETVYFGSFCEYYDDLEKVCTMHACCCIGLDNKLHDLKIVAADWKSYTSLTPELRQKGGFNWTYPTTCRNSIGWQKP